MTFLFWWASVPELSLLPGSALELSGRQTVT